MKGRKIVFMGTPGFAVATLEKLLLDGHKIVGVITAPDKPAGRGRQLQESEVKKYALSKGLHILHPTNLKDPEFISKLRELSPDLQIVVAFRMLPESVWNMPRLGTYNLHGSLLPKYRGAAPINWAVINGEKETGVTTFKLKHEIDSGNILFREKISIGPEESAGEVHDRLMQVGAELMSRTVKLIFESDEKQEALTFIEQKEEEITHAPKLNRDNCRIDWKKEGLHIHDQIRGLCPFPGAWCTMKIEGDDPLEIKIFSSRFLPGSQNSDAGTAVIEKNKLKVKVKDGELELGALQVQGKKRMNAPEMLNGFRLEGRKVTFL